MSEQNVGRTSDGRASIIERMSEADAKTALSFLAGYWPARFDELIDEAEESISTFRVGGSGDE